MGKVASMAITYVAGFEVGVPAIFAAVGAVSLGGVSGKDSPSP